MKKGQIVYYGSSICKKVIVRGVHDDMVWIEDESEDWDFNKYQIVRKSEVFTSMKKYAENDVEEHEREVRMARSRLETSEKHLQWARQRAEDSRKKK